MRGTACDESYWLHREIPASWPDPFSQPHRLWLAQQLQAFAPVSSMLEVGCGYGPNLAVLERFFPGAQVSGVDLDSRIVMEANRRLQRNAASVGKADDLRAIETKSADIVLADAVLLYVGDDKIAKAISEFVRVARKAVCLVEFHEPSADRKARLVEDGWVRNYRALIQHVCPQCTVNVTKLPPGMFSIGRWPAYGHYICASSLPESPDETTVYLTPPKIEL